MPILVSDTSVLIDLERGALEEACCRLSHGLVVPDLLYRRELEAHGGPRWLEWGLTVAELTDAEVQVAQDTRREVPQLSLPDSFAYALALDRHWTLLTGDGALRSHALSRQLPVHGLLWVIEELRAQALLEDGVLLAALQTISGHPRCRLPRAAVNSLLSLLGGL